MSVTRLQRGRSAPQTLTPPTSTAGPSACAGNEALLLDGVEMKCCYWMPWILVGKMEQFYWLPWNNVVLLLVVMDFGGKNGGLRLDDVYFAGNNGVLLLDGVAFSGNVAGLLYLVAVKRCVARSFQSIWSYKFLFEK